MPEYLAPGVYIEEIDIGPKPIEGVSTSTAGFLGPTERGPIDPTLITSHEEFQRKFGDFISDSYLAYAVDGFFRNGGKRCYISRIYSMANATFGEIKIPAGTGEITIKTSGPGDWGNRVYYKIEDANLHKEGDPERLKFFKLSIRYYSRKPDDTNRVDPKNQPIEEIYDNLSVIPSSNSYYKNMVAGVSNFIRIWDNFLDQEDENTIERPGGEAGVDQWTAFENVEGTGAPACLGGSSG